MTPNELEELITPYLLGDLDSDRAAEVKAFVAVNEQGQAIKAEAAATLSLLHDAFADAELVEAKGLAADSTTAGKSAKRRNRRREPIRIPVRLWAHAAGILVFFGFGYLLVQSMLPLVSNRAKAPSFPMSSPPPAVAAQPGGEPNGGTVAERPRVDTWTSFGSGGVQVLNGYESKAEDGFLVLKKDAVFMNVSSGIETGMAIAPGTSSAKMDWVREQSAGARRWIIGGKQADGETLYSLTILPANGDLGSNPKAWPANFQMSVDAEFAEPADATTALADLMLMAASYQPAPSASSGRTLQVDGDIATALLASGTIQIIGTLGQEVVLKSRDGYNYVVAGWDMPTAKAEATKAGQDVEFE